MEGQVGGSDKLGGSVRERLDSLHAQVVGSGIGERMMMDLEKIINILEVVVEEVAGLKEHSHTTNAALFKKEGGDDGRKR